MSESERVGEDQGIMQELLSYGRHPPDIFSLALHGSCVHHSARHTLFSGCVHRLHSYSSSLCTVVRSPVQQYGAKHLIANLEAVIIPPPGEMSTELSSSTNRDEARLKRHSLEC